LSRRCHRVHQSRCDKRKSAHSLSALHGLHHATSLLPFQRLLPIHYRQPEFWIVLQSLCWTVHLLKHHPLRPLCTPKFDAATTRPCQVWCYLGQRTAVKTKIG